MKRRVLLCLLISSFISVLVIVSSTSISWAKLEVETIISELRKDLLEQQTEFDSQILYLGGFGITYQEANDFQLRQFLKIDNNREWIEATLQQNWFGQGLHNWVTYKQDCLTEQQIDSAALFIKLILKTAVFGMLDDISKTSGLSFLRGTFTTLSTMMTILDGARAVSNFVSVVDCSYYGRELFAEYIRLRKNKEPNEAFEELYESVIFRTAIEFIFNIRYLKKLSDEDTRRIAPEYLECRYQSWKLAAEIDRREAIKRFILDNTPPPLVDAGPDQTVQIGTAVQLNGTAFCDPGITPRYHWHFIIPDRDKPELSNPKIANPTFIANQEGIYLLDLEVKCGKLVDSDSVLITAKTNADLPSITSSLKLIEPPPYYVGSAITAQFTITNKGTSSITLDVLTVGGRGPDGQVADFQWHSNITLEPIGSPNASYAYQGQLTPSKVGTYHFFTAYRTLDGQWNTNIPTESGVSNTLDITASAPAPVLSSITITPSIAALTVGDTQQFTATAFDQFNNPMVPQPSFTWASSNTAIGTVNSAGLFSALSAGGPINVTASVGSISGSASVTVSTPAPVLTSIGVTPSAVTVAVGSTQQFTATALDQYGNPIIPQPSFTWISSNASIGTVDATGLFTGVSVGGPITITASVGSVSGSASVTVGAPPPPPPAKSPWPMFGHDAQHTGRSEYTGPQSINVTWEYDLGFIVNSNCGGANLQPVIGNDGTIYFGIGEAQCGTKAPWGKLYAMNNGGTLVWESVDFESPVFSTPAIGPDGTIYVPTYDKGVYALNSDGREKWRFYEEGIGYVTGISVGNDGIIYFTASQGLYSLNPDGSSNWVFCCGPRGGAARGGPAIGKDGSIYVLWTGFIGGTDGENGALHAYFPDGTLKWSVRLNYGYVRSTPPAISPDGTIYVATGYYSGVGWRLHAFNESGEQIWETPTVSSGYPEGSPVIADGNVVVAANWSQLCGYDLWCFASGLYAFSLNGDILWEVGPHGGQTSNSTRFTQPIIDSKGTVFIAENVSPGGYWTMVRLYRINQQGVVNQTLDVPGTVFSSLVIGANEDLYAVLPEHQESVFYKIKVYAFGQ